MLESGPMDRATGVGFTRARMVVGMLGSLSGGWFAAARCCVAVVGGRGICRFRFGGRIAGGGGRGVFGIAD